MNYLVSYDLNKPGKDYSGVHKAIESASAGVWCKPLESVYVIRSSLTAQAIYNKICPFLDTSDRILVIEVTGNSYWYLEKDVNDYLQKML